MIMKRLNIPNYRVRSERMKHTWNIVKINGSWYNIDVTWNDPVGIDEDSVSYLYFLKSDRGMMENSSQRNPHYSSDENIEDTNNTDRDFNALGEYSLKKPLFVNNKFIFINNDILNRYDKTINVKEYNPDENKVYTYFSKAESFKLNNEDKTYLFGFNTDDKVLEMYDMGNLKNPVAISDKIEDLESLNRFTYGGSNETLPLYNYIVSSANIEDGKVKVEMLQNSSRWNVDFNKPKSITINFDVKSVVNQPEEVAKPEETTVTEPTEEVTKPEDPNAKIKSYIASETDINRLIGLYNRSYNKEIRDEIMNRFSELDEIYTREYINTYDVNIANKVLSLKSILRKDNSQIYAEHNKFNTYIQANNNYVNVVNGYYNRMYSYKSVLNAYKLLETKYNMLSETYRQNNPLDEVINDI